MGLIKAAASAIGSTLGDQWKDYIKCDDLGQNILMRKVTTSSGIISKDSAIQVAPGQIAVIFDSGKIVDATAEQGIYTFDQSTSPSFFAGQFGPVFKEMWTRFVYNGATNKEQAVFYLNAKEIIDNKFGTPAPIPYQDWGHPLPNEMTGIMTPMRVEVKCFGKYTFKISDPAVFMSKIAGTTDVFGKEEIVSQMRSEVIASFQNVLSELGSEKHKVFALDLPNSTDEIKKTMDERVFDQPIRDRGLSIVGFIVESVTLDDDSEKKIDDYELASNSHMRQGKLVGAYANAVEGAANNASGAMNGFMGIGMMNMASGGMFGAMQNNTMAPQNVGPTHAAYAQGTTPNGQPLHPGVVANGANAEELAPVANIGVKAFCPNCGTKNEGFNFCGNCGTKLS